MKWDEIDPEILAYARDTSLGEATTQIRVGKVPGTTLSIVDRTNRGKFSLSHIIFDKRSNIQKAIAYSLISIFSIVEIMLICWMVFASWQSGRVQQNMATKGRRIQQELETLKPADLLFEWSNLIGGQISDQTAKVHSLESLRQNVDSQLSGIEQLLSLNEGDQAALLRKAKLYMARSRIHQALGGQTNLQMSVGDITNSIIIYDRLLLSEGNFGSYANIELAFVANSLVTLLSPQVEGEGLPNINRPIIERVSADLARFEKIQENSPATIEAKAIALLYQAQLRHILGTQEDDVAALANLDQAMTIFTRLPYSSNQLSSLATTTLLRVSVLGPRGDFGNLIDSLKSIITNLQAHVDAHPERLEFRILLSKALSSRATGERAYSVKLRLEDAVKNANTVTTLLTNAGTDYQKALELLDKSTPGGSDDASILEWKSGLAGNYGLFLLDLAPTVDSPLVGDSLNYLSLSLKVAGDLDRRFPNSYSFQNAKASALANMGYAKVAIGQLVLSEKGFVDAATISLNEGKELCLRSKSIYDSLRVTYPESRDIVWGQAYSRFLLGMAMFFTKDDKQKQEALTLLKQARDSYEILKQKYKGVELIINESKSLGSFMESNGIK